MDVWLSGDHSREDRSQGAEMCSIRWGSNTSDVNQSSCARIESDPILKLRADRWQNILSGGNLRKLVTVQSMKSFSIFQEKFFKILMEFASKPPKEKVLTWNITMIICNLNV